VSHIDATINDGIMTLRLNRPDKMNAITAAMYADAAAALTAAEQNKDVRTVVITGTGDVFTAGNDMKDFLDDPAADPNSSVFQFMRTLMKFSKPVIAALNGIAVGIGVTMLPHCDLVYAVPGTYLQAPFVNIAIVPEFGSTLLLRRTIGLHRANEMLLLGEKISAERAREFGLVNDIFPAEQFMVMVMEKAKTLAAKPPMALRQAKQLMRGDLGEISARMTLENTMMIERFTSPELQEAVQAFLEKRPADYSRFG